MLAGLSTDYYARLEQGRDNNPSAQVLASLAQAFRLSPDATEHLYTLAQPRAGFHAATAPVDRLDLRVLRFLERWDDASAFVVNRRLDILAKNRVATGLLSEFEHTDNLIRLTFLSPIAREFWLDWEQEAAANVAHLRAVAGADHDDPSLRKLVDELSRGSEDFRRLWARHDVRGRTRGLVRLHHGRVGEITLWNETFRIDSVPGLRVFVGEPEPGPSSDAMARLCALSCGGR
ncbi:helix-turn-helix transcriptional regulator [Planotetraspora phitsanulokensis]|uniref:Transcriptional regulator n=2 Tax=Planotetraspora phitsanulokensis TaxID=575192 RepID=A0A8J3U522_9ACTN|nr:transcriptional regulator [Planotetraspora phitsanulokensis]